MEFRLPAASRDSPCPPPEGGTPTWGTLIRMRPTCVASETLTSKRRCDDPFRPMNECWSALNPRLRILNQVWGLTNNYTFVALKLAWGEARGRECIRSDTRPTEQRSPRSISAQSGGRHVVWAEALLLAPHRPTSGYARPGSTAGGTPAATLNR